MSFVHHVDLIISPALPTCPKLVLTLGCGKRWWNMCLHKCIRLPTTTSLRAGGSHKCTHHKICLLDWYFDIHWTSYLLSMKNLLCVGRMRLIFHWNVGRDQHVSETLVLLVRWKRYFFPKHMHLLNFWLFKFFGVSLKKKKKKKLFIMLFLSNWGKMFLFLLVNEIGGFYTKTKTQE